MVCVICLCSSCLHALLFIPSSMETICEAHPRLFWQFLLIFCDEATLILQMVGLKETVDFGQNHGQNNQFHRNLGMKSTCILQFSGICYHQWRYFIIYTVEQIMDLICWLTIYCLIMGLWLYRLICFGVESGIFVLLGLKTCMTFWFALPVCAFLCFVLSTPTGVLERAETTFALFSCLQPLLNIIL